MSNIKKVLEEDSKNIVYTATYAWISYPAGFRAEKPTEEKIFCAWCKKSQADIKKTEDLNEHIEKHVRNDEVLNKQK